MPQFNLEDYETVEERIHRLYQQHPDARITTALVSPVESIESVAVFEASVYLDGDTPKATGFAMEKAGQGPVNKTSHVENCETSAIGRALANMGLHGNKRPSREEMQKAQNNNGHEASVDEAYKRTVQYVNESGLAESMVKSYLKECEDAYELADKDKLRGIWQRVTEAKHADS